MNRNKIQVLYSLLQGFYWVLFGITISFANSYLFGLGVSTAVIGLITAVFSGIAALTQAYLGKISKKTPKLNWKSIMLYLLALRIIMNIILMASPSKMISTISFGLAIFSMHVMLPFVSTANFYYISNGVDINYGLARGVGSLFFAVMTMIVGNLVSSHGIYIILLSGLVGSLVFAIPLILLPYDSKLDHTKAQSHEDELQTSFFRKYPQFSLSLIAFVIIMAIHNNMNTFFLQIIQSVGASNKELGRALFIAAISELPVMLGFSWILKKFKTKTMMLVSALAFAMKTGVYLISTTITGIYLGQVLQLFSFALFIAACVYYTQERMSKSDSQLGQTMAASAVTLGSVLGSLSGGFLIKRYSISINLIVMIILGMIAFIVLYLAKEDEMRTNK